MSSTFGGGKSKSKESGSTSEQLPPEVKYALDFMSRAGTSLGSQYGFAPTGQYTGGNQSSQDLSGMPGGVQSFFGGRNGSRQGGNNQNPNLPQGYGPPGSGQFGGYQGQSAPSLGFSPPSFGGNRGRLNVDPNSPQTQYTGPVQNPNSRFGVSNGRPQDPTAAFTGDQIRVGGPVDDDSQQPRMTQVEADQERRAEIAREQQSFSPSRAIQDPYNFAEFPESFGSSASRYSPRYDIPQFSPFEGGTGFSSPSAANQGGFNAAAYLIENPDVAADGMDPFEHYNRYGKAEGRGPGGVGSNVTSAAARANILEYGGPAEMYSGYGTASGGPARSTVPDFSADTLAGFGKLRGAFVNNPAVDQLESMTRGDYLTSNPFTGQSNVYGNNANTMNRNANVGGGDHRQSDVFANNANTMNRNANVGGARQMAAGLMANNVNAMNPYSTTVNPNAGITNDFASVANMAAGAGNQFAGQQGNAGQGLNAFSGMTNTSANDANPFLSGSSDLSGVTDQITNAARLAVGDRFAAAGRSGSGNEGFNLAQTVSRELAPYAFNAREADQARRFESGENRVGRVSDTTENRIGRLTDAGERQDSRRYDADQTRIDRQSNTRESQIDRSATAEQAQIQNAIMAEESRLGRTLTSDEAAATRRFSSGESFADRSYQGRENLIDRSMASQESALGRGYGSDEAQYARQFGAGETSADRAYQGQENYIDRNIAAQESAFGRDYGSDEARYGRQFGAGEASAGRDFQGQESYLGRDFAAQEAAQGRGFTGYEAERGRQVQAISQLLGIPLQEAQNYLNIGGMVEGQQRDKALEPFDILDRLTGPLATVLSGAPRATESRGRSRKIDVFGKVSGSLI